MQQDQAGGGENIKNQDNRRVLKPPAAQGEVPHQPQQPQKCPRCDSMNTKFCYYNNYSLSQPRYFCKTCRRYWTQGGTLRSVPVGGGCRKGKRAKTSNSSSSSSTDQVMKPNFQTPQTSFSLMGSGPGSSSTASTSLAVPTGMGTYFSNDAGGLLTSLATIHSINNQPPAVSFTLNQPLNLGGDLGGNSSNLGLLYGFNAISSFGSSQSRQFSSYVPLEENLVRPSIRSASAGNSQQPNWHQGFPSSVNNSSIVSDTSLWSISTTTTAAGNTGVGSSSSLNPNHQWPDLPGYGNPP